MLVELSVPASAIFFMFRIQLIVIYHAPRPNDCAHISFLASMCKLLTYKLYNIFPKIFIT